MAEFEIDFPDDFLEDLLETDFDEICEEGLTQAAPIMENALKQSLKAVIQHSGDSELINSVKAAKPKKTKTDAWIINVNPKGDSKSFYTAKGKSKRRYPVSNALKAIWLEYGVAGRQSPRPFLQNAVNNMRESILTKVQEVYNKKTGAE